jgi:hypothetical protein
MIILPSPKTLPLLFEVRKLAHFSESDARLTELVLELQNFDLREYISTLSPNVANLWK